MLLLHLIILILLFQTQINPKQNLTFSDDVRRLHVPFGVAYGSDIDDVIKIILESLARSH